MTKPTLPLPLDFIDETSSKLRQAISVLRMVEFQFESPDSQVANTEDIASALGVVHDLLCEVKGKVDSAPVMNQQNTIAVAA